MNRALRRFLPLAVLAGLAFVAVPNANAQDPEPALERPEPPKLDDFEHDDDGDGVPDGWYNLRDGKIVKEGGPAGPTYLKFECNKMGRPARLSRAFGVDGRKHEAIVLGLWVRGDQIQAGERQGDDPGLIIDFLGDKLRQQTRGAMGPWNVRTIGTGHWVRVAKRIPVPPEARDAIMSIGLLGATGVLDVDGLTVELIPVGPVPTTNIARNPGFELGDPEPNAWVARYGAHRAFPGYKSAACLELARSESQALTSLAVPVEPFGALNVSLRAKGQGLRGAGGATASVFFIDEEGRPVGQGAPALRWSGSFDWRQDNGQVNVPRGAVHAVLQFDKVDGIGTLRIDDVNVTAAPDPEAGSWTPYHVVDETDDWKAVVPSTGIEPGSALDFSFLLDGPAGKSGHVLVRSGRLTYTKGGRARFFGVHLLAPTAFLEPKKADALADRLARSGVNLVHLGDLDTPLGPDRSLFDDTVDDTQHFDTGGLARLDHLIAALKSRGIYVALELIGSRRYRPDDGVASPGGLPPGGGPAAVFDPTITKLETETAKKLLAHVNAETGISLRTEPALAWVTLAGEVSLFDLIDEPNSLPGDYSRELKALAAQSTSGVGRRFWQGLESNHYKTLAETLRKGGLKAPIAGVSHYRRELEFSEAQAAPGLDLIDDRLFWNPSPFLSPRFRSMMWDSRGGLIFEAARKRRPDRPYVVGQWCNFSSGVWSTPYEAAEGLLGAATAVGEDWDALVRRGVFLWPEEWGRSAPGTAGGEDIFQVPEVANAAPHTFGLWPHAASLMLRGHEEADAKTGDKTKADSHPRVGSRKAAAPRGHVSGWDPERGRLVIDTPYTQGVAGWPGEEAVTFPSLIMDVENSYGVVIASSAGTEPVAKTKRLLVSAVGRFSPTGFRWVDPWRRETADPGRPPLLQEPVKGKVTWRAKGPVKAFALDNNGRRIGPATVKTTESGATLILDASTAALHFEMVAE